MPNAQWKPEWCHHFWAGKVPRSDLLHIRSLQAILWAKIDEDRTAVLAAVARGEWSTNCNIWLGQGRKMAQIQASPGIKFAWSSREPQIKADYHFATLEAFGSPTKFEVKVDKKRFFLSFFSYRCIRLGWSLRCLLWQHQTKTPFLDLLPGFLQRFDPLSGRRCSQMIDRLLLPMHINDDRTEQTML